MTAQEYIKSKLADLNKSLGIEKPSTDDQLKDAIFKIIMSKKFRKYSANSELTEHIKKAVDLNIKKRQPISFTFLHGAYKLWRLDEAPEADWAELFAATYYTNWLKLICEIYEPGVWFDFFVDDYILPILHTASDEDEKNYRASFQKVIDFLKQYQPSNYKMTITSVGEQFESREAFEQKLEADIKRYQTNLSVDLPEVNDARTAMIELNVNPALEDSNDPKWKEKNTLAHDAYISLTKFETGYHFMPEKIKVFNQPLPSGTVIAVGTTKDSIAKFWVGIGALKPKDDTYRQIILSPNQIKNTEFEFENVSFDGLDGKNFNKIRIIKT